MVAETHIQDGKTKDWFDDLKAYLKEAGVPASDKFLENLKLLPANIQLSFRQEIEDAEDEDKEFVTKRVINVVANLDFKHMSESKDADKEQHASGVKRKSSWVKDLGYENKNAASKSASQSSETATEDKKPEDVVVKSDQEKVKMLDIAQAAMQQRAIDEKERIENAAKAEAEAAVKKAKDEHSNAKNGLLKAQQQSSHYEGSMTAKVGLTSLIAGAAMFVVLVFFNPIVAAGVGLLTAIGAGAAQYMSYSESRDTAKQNLQKAEERVEKAASAEARAIEDAKEPAVKGKAAERKASYAQKIAEQARNEVGLDGKITL